MIPPTATGFGRSTPMLSSPSKSVAGTVYTPSKFLHDRAIDAKDGHINANSTHEFEALETSSGEKEFEYDPDYFIESSFAIFQVENTLFRVPTYMLVMGSQHFSEIFKLHKPASMDGDLARIPISIPARLGISRDDFKAFVKALYPHSLFPDMYLSKHEWISVLKLSTIWHFLDFRHIAIRELERGQELSYVDKIVLGRSYWVSSWVSEGLIGMAERDATISDEDNILIDFTTAVRLLRIRESRFRAQLMGGTQLDIAYEVHDVFDEELAHITGEEDAYRKEEHQQEKRRQQQEEKEHREREAKEQKELEEKIRRLERERILKEEQERKEREEADIFPVSYEEEKAAPTKAGKRSSSSKVTHRF